MASMRTHLGTHHGSQEAPTIPLPKSWTKHVRTAMLHAFLLAQYATAYARCPVLPKNSVRVAL